MTFFCFIDSTHSSTPHMEPIDAETVDEANSMAARLIQQHRRAIAARVFKGSQEVAVLQNGEAA